MDIVKLHAIVFGKVQGVGFRYFVRKKAILYKLNGWTRNRFDLTVELVVEGNKIDIEDFLIAINAGPPSSDVYKINSKWEEASGEYNKFKIRPTVYK